MLKYSKRGEIMDWTHTSLINYFIKDLCPDEQRGIWGYIKDNCTSSFAIKYAKHQNNLTACLKQDFCLFDTEEQLKDYLQIYINHFEAVNNRMKRNGRAPLFENPNDLMACFDWVKTLLTFDDKSRWNTLLGCTSFEDYKPKTVQKGMLAVIDLYIENYQLNKNITLALTEMRGEKDCIESGITHNVYEYVNLKLLKNGIQPIFEDVNDKKACNEKRREILDVRPLKKVLGYLGVSSQEEYKAPTTTPLCLTLEKYTRGRHFSVCYEVARHIHFILADETLPEKVLEYAEYVNALCRYNVFDNLNDLTACKETAKKLKELIPLEEITKQ